MTDGVRILETPSWAPLAAPDDGWGPLDILYRSARALFEPCDLAIAFAHPPNVALPAWILARLRRRPLLYDWCDWYEGGIFPKRLEARARGLAGAERPLQPRVERADVALERRMPRLAGAVSVISPPTASISSPTAPTSTASARSTAPTAAARSASPPPRRSPVTSPIITPTKSCCSAPSPAPPPPSPAWRSSRPARRSPARWSRGSASPAASSTSASSRPNRSR